MADTRFPYRNEHKLLRYICVVIMFATMQHQANATIYKCVDESGNTTYTGTPCAVDESSKRISESSAASTGQDCRVARNFAYTTSKQLKEGNSSDAVFASYGGLNNLSPAAVGLISYIYTFRGNNTVNASRIATLATERCENGSFGTDASHCEAYPYEFIQSMGGCDAAYGSANSALPALGAARPNEPMRFAPLESQSNVTKQSSTDSVEKNAHQECRDRLSESVASTERLMSEPQSGPSMDMLKNRHRTLRSQLSRC